MTKAETIFAHELNLIHDKTIKNFVIECFDKLCPDYFWTCPCSTTGKYHPQVSLGVGGLVRHTKLAVWWGIELLRMWPLIPDTSYDEIIAALILHDMLKNGEGLGPDGYPLDRGVTGTHGVTLADKIKDPENNIRFKRIVTAIRDHMGKWTKGFQRTNDDIIRNTKDGHIVCITVHLADYCASRKVDKIYSKLETEITYDFIKESTDTKEVSKSPPCPGVRKTESRQTTATENGQ